jgi:hypothetical protein
VCVIHTTHAGELQSDVECGKCGNVKSAFDPMMDVSLELKGRGKDEEETLESCLQRFVLQVTSALSISLGPLDLRRTKSLGRRSKYHVPNVEQIHKYVLIISSLLLV